MTPEGWARKALEGVTFEAHKPEDALLAEAATMGMIAYHAGIISEAIREARNAALEEAAKAVENTAYVEYQAGCKAPSNESVRSILAQTAAAIREKIK